MTIISIKTEGFKEAEKMLAHIPKAFPRAASEAINRGLTAGRTLATKLIRGRYNIKASAVKKEGLMVKKASWKQIDGALEAKGPMLSVHLFSPKGGLRRTTPRGVRRQVVSISIIRGTRKKIKGAFMVGARVMERRQPVRFPIFPVSTIGIPYMIRYIGIAKQVETKIADATAKRLNHNVRLLLTK